MIKERIMKEQILANMFSIRMYEYSYMITLAIIIKAWF